MPAIMHAIRGNQNLTYAIMDILQVEDSELQDEPLQIRLMDYDTYSANDAIGKVYLDLNPLLISPIPSDISPAPKQTGTGWNSTRSTGGLIIDFITKTVYF